LCDEGVLAQIEAFADLADGLAEELEGFDQGEFLA
jgi:hypothetical protein